MALIEPSDLERAKPNIKSGDIVLITPAGIANIPTARNISAMRPDLSKRAADWLVKKRVKIVGVDTAIVDHPLATSLGPHRNGPQIKYLIPEYRRRPAARRSTIFRNGIRRTGRCSQPASRRSRMSAAISTS